LLTEGVGVEAVFDAPVAGETRAAGGVEAGVSTPSRPELERAAASEAAGAVVPVEAAFAEGVTGVFSSLGEVSPVDSV
jgi:hypothetical protein